MQVHVQKLVSALSNALDARFEHAKTQENNNQMGFFSRLKKFYITLHSENFGSSVSKSLKTGIEYETLKTLFATAANNQSKGNDSAFIAQYALEKICKILRTPDDKTALDPYTGAIVANALLSSGSISSKGALRSLCRNIELDAFDESELIRYCAKVEQTTASTQRSSTREALRMLKLADINKGKKGEPITLTDAGKRFFSFLIAEPVSAESVSA